MPFVIPVVIAIGSAVAAAVSAVAVVVATVVSTIAAALAAIGSVIAGAVSGIVGGIATAISDIAIGFSVYSEGIWAIADFAGTSFFTQVGAYAAALTTSFGSFLEAIHFKTLLAINNIAYLVSKDYREMMSGIYSKMGEVSYALGYSADFLNLVIRDARAVVLDVAAMTGKKYDVAEVTWLNQFQGYLKVFSDQAHTYTKNPAAVFADIDRWLVKPAIDTKAGAMQTVYGSMESTIAGLKATIESVDKFRKDLGKLASDLPGTIRDHVKPMIDGIFKTWDDWIRTDYKPSLKLMDGVINALGIQQTTQASKHYDLLRRLKRPGDYVREIDGFPKDEREDQEQKISEVTLAPWIREGNILRPQRDRELTEIRERYLAAPGERIPPAWEISVMVFPLYLEKPEYEKRNTWFVGEY